MPNVLIVNSNPEYDDLLSLAGYKVYRSKYGRPDYNMGLIPEMDLVMFTGGEDVHPSFYNGVHKGISFCNKARDLDEQNLFKCCLEHSIRMTGICRGIQFLNVMCGGRMHQHITHHGGVLHDLLFPAQNKMVKVSSTHHQLVILPDDAIPIAWTPDNMSSSYIGPDAVEVEAPIHEIEAAVYPKYNAFGVQFHPEMIWCAKDGRNYYLQILSDFVNTKLDGFIEQYGVNNGKERGKAA